MAYKESLLFWGIVPFGAGTVGSWRPSLVLKKFTDLLGDLRAGSSPY